MGRAFCKKDENHEPICEALEGLGQRRHDTHMVKDGFPDVCFGVAGLTLVGRFNLDEARRRLAGMDGLYILDGANVLLEIKTEGGKLTGPEREWHASWQGQVAIVRTEQEAAEAIGLPALI